MVSYSAGLGWTTVISDIARRVVRVVGGFYLLCKTGQKGGFINMGGSNIACRIVGICHSCPFSHVLFAALALGLVLSKLMASCHSFPFSALLSVVRCGGAVYVCMVMVVVVVVTVIV